jgi:2',3'-cyclic-nucleotide 2'-phosphodiesterase (5'-nucleotidase family)
MSDTSPATSWTIQSTEVAENDTSAVTNVVTFVHINDHHSHVDEHELVLAVRDLPNDIVQRLKMFRDGNSSSTSHGCGISNDMIDNISNNNNDSSIYSNNSSIYNASTFAGYATCAPQTMNQQIVIRYGTSPSPLPSYSCCVN